MTGFKLLNNRLDQNLHKAWTLPDTLSIDLLLIETKVLTNFKIKQYRVMTLTCSLRD